MATDIPVHHGGTTRVAHPKTNGHASRTQENHGAGHGHETHGAGKPKTTGHLETHPANHSSNPHNSRQVTGHQANAAGHVLHGNAHGAPHADAHGAPHGSAGGHGPDPVEKGGQKLFETVDYSNIATENLGHRWAHGAGHGNGHGNAHGANGHGAHGGAPPQHAAPTPEPVKAPETAPTRPAPAGTPRVQVREAHGEMAEMVENMKRNGADIPEPTTPVRPKLQPTGEMAEYVDAIKAAEERELAAYRASRKPATAGSTAATAELTRAATGGEVAAEGVAHSGKSASNLSRLGSKMTKAAGVAEGVLGPLGVYYGIKEANHGLHQIHDAKNGMEKMEGVANVGVGSGTAIVGAAGTGTVALAALKGAGAISSTGAAAGAIGVLSKVSGVAAGGVAVVDGVRDIAHGIHDKDGGRVAKGGIKTLAGGAMIAGVMTGNPVLVAGGAITYAGVTIYENRKEIAAFAGHVSDKVSATAGAVKDSVVAGVSNAANGAVNLAKDAGSMLSGGWKMATSWW